MKKKKQAHPRRAKNLHKKLKNISADTNKQESESFLDELIGWFSDHQQQQIDQLFSRGGSVNLKDFELGLMSLAVPCQQFQLHMLTQQLKTFNDMISYQDLIKQIQSLSHSTEGGLQMF